MCVWKIVWRVICVHIKYVGSRARARFELFIFEIAHRGGRIGWVSISTTRQLCFDGGGGGGGGSSGGGGVGSNGGHDTTTNILNDDFFKIYS